MLERYSAGKVNQIYPLRVGDVDGITEIKTLIQSPSGIRKPSTIIGLVERRLEYVQRNISVLEAGQEEISAGNDEVVGEEGVMEINELLDEEGNVVSASVVRPGDAAKGVLDVLRKGGIQDFGGDITTAEAGEISEQAVESHTVGSGEAIVSETKSVSPVDAPLIQDMPPALAAEAVKKVRFAEAVEVGKDEPIEDPVIPEGESVEEAALRREMLEYCMRDVGTIVAEMDLSDDEVGDEDEEEGEEDEDGSDEEDAFGRNTMQAISDEYRDKMLKLEKRLNAKAVINIGPNPEDVKIEATAVQDLPEQTATVETKLEQSKPGQRKAVRFAEELDVQDKPITTETNGRGSKTLISTVKPFKDAIVEREPVDVSSIDSAKKKVSKFRANRLKESVPAALTGPVSRKYGRYGDGDDLYPRQSGMEEEKQEPSNATIETINPSIIERPPDHEIDLYEPDMLDPDLHAAEVRNAYHVMRNKMIQRENGFMDQELEEYEDEYGRPVVSRFKAARLATRQR